MQPFCEQAHASPFSHHKSLSGTQLQVPTASSKIVSFKNWPHFDCNSCTVCVFLLWETAIYQFGVSPAMLT